MSLPRLKQRRDAARGQRTTHVRYAVVGLGHIAQNAVLPAFENASRNSELAALISDDPAKLKTFARKYDVDGKYSYAEFETALEEDQIDAVYIALPNDMHAEYTLR